jgi:hypothetical protein
MAGDSDVSEEGRMMNGKRRASSSFNDVSWQAISP